MPLSAVKSANQSYLVESTSVDRYAVLELIISVGRHAKRCFIVDSINVMKYVILVNVPIAPDFFVMGYLVHVVMPVYQDQSLVEQTLRIARNHVQGNENVDIHVYTSVISKNVLRALNLFQNNVLVVT